MASSSSSPHSSSSKSSQPLHNFELPPLLKWHRKNGKSATTPKRNRSTMKTTAAAPAVPPPPQPEPPLLHLVAAAALFEADLMPPPPPREPVGGKAKEAAALDDEFERLSLLREESRRNNRGREADQPPVISYSRNHQKKSSSSSSSAKNRHSFNKTLSISHAPAPRLSPPKFPAPPGPKVLVNYVDPGHRRRSTNASAIEAESYSWSSYYKGKGSDAKSEKSASSSAWKKHDWFNKSSPAEDADAFSKIPFYKKFEFVSKSKPDYSLSNSEFKLKFEVPEEDHSSKIEKLSMVAAEAAEAAAPHHNLYYLKKSAKANSKDKMKSKVVEDSHLPPKKKPSFAIASPINPKIPLLKPKLEKPDAPEKKSKPAESEALKIKIEPKEVVKEKAENPKKDTNLTGDDAEATRVWNLRPRIPKGTDKDKDNDKDKGKAVAQPQRKSGGASTSGAEKEKPVGVSVSLTKEEIEDDIFALTGRKPARRPKKRPRNVQKNLDAVFPGLWLTSISKDTYKVSEKK